MYGLMSAEIRIYNNSTINGVARMMSHGLMQD